MPARASISRSKERGKRSQAALPREVKLAYEELRQSVTHLQKSTAEIQDGLRKTEHRIEANARAQIRELRADSRAQLGVLRPKQREAARMLKNLRSAVRESWREVKHSVDSILADARATAASAIERFPTAIGV